MCALMYRQRPSYPALISAGAVLLLGMLMVLALKQQQQEVSFQTLLLTACITFCLAAMLLMVAFARYRFTHLWKQPDPAFSRKRATHK